MFRSTVTVYNLVKDRKGDTYQRTVIEGVHWESEKGIKLGDAVIKSENSIVVVIPFTIEGFELPIAFQRLVDKSDKWTLAEGDFVIKGSQDKEIIDVADIQEFDEAMTISSYELNDQAMMKRLNNYTAYGK